MRTLAPVIALAAALAWIYRHLFRGELLAGRDVLRLAYPDAALLRRSLLEGELPLWNPHVFLGQPFLATLQAQALYPPRVGFVLLFGPYWGVSLLQVFHAGLAAVGGTLAARALGRSRLASALAGAVFGLSPLFTELSGTPNLVSAAAWSGVILWAALRGRPVALGAAVALAVLSGSPETVLWQAVLCAAVLVGKGRRRLPSAAGGWGLGALLSAAVWLPALELAAHSSRSEGKGSHLDWSASWRQLAALFLPNADQPRGPYWGEDQWLLLQLFLGAAVVALGLLGARRQRWVAAAVGALLLLSLGRHFPPAEWLLSLPGLRSFRYPAKALVGASFGLAVLAAFGFDHCRAWVRRRRRVPKAAALGGGVLLLGAFVTSVWVAVVLSGLALLLVAARPRAFAPLLAALVGLELLVFHAAHVGTSLARAEHLARPAPLAAVAAGERISVDYRPPPDAPPAEAEVVEVTRGRDAFAEASRTFALPNRFVEDGLTVLEGYGAPEPPRIQQFHLARSREVADLAGVALFVRADALAFDDLTDVTPDPEGPRVGRSATALPRARVLHHAERVTDEVALQRIQRGMARDVVLLAEPQGDATPPSDCTGSSARVTHERPNGVVLEVNACARGHLLLADAYFPGWEATVDGVATPVQRAQFALRAVAVPQGAHTVRFDYRPLSFRIGAWISTLSLVGAAVLWARRRRR